MADAGDAPMEGMREIFARLMDKLDTRDQVIRLDERVTRNATREEMNAADARVLEAVSVMFDRSTASNQQYVRDQISAGAMSTKTALLEFEKHLVGLLESTAKKAADSAAAGVIAALPPPPPPQEDRRGVHPIIPYGGGTTIVVSAVWVIAQIMGLRIPTGG